MAAHTQFGANGWSKQVKLVLSHCGSKFCVEFKKAKHVGVFPEQVVHWSWVRKQLKRLRITSARVLVLFGYTGVWLNELGNNVQVTCVDVDTSVIRMAKANSALTQRVRTRWVNADAFKFLRKCVKNNLKFNVVVADPPAVGWINAKRCNLILKLTELVTLISEVCDNDVSLVCLSLYSNRYDNFVVHELVKRVVLNIKTIDSGSVIVREIAGETLGARIPSSRFVRWTKQRL
ncbi:MAG: hypothetical protein AAJB65_00810 [Candidatus Hodgkinia cicadicola]